MNEAQRHTINLLRAKGYLLSLDAEWGSYVFVALRRKLRAGEPICLRIRTDGSYKDLTRIRDYKRNPRSAAWVN